mmetsp:Transcript_14796/g.21148  ORF Transcript_14796/g.21148 Transcript_14796/m.21148 type:complete len:575 (+) Transcript_14796:65-1789(+)|eukprot:CAMPEP_0184868910 /NCGR_PEP_ID=MMETSP0580-20130426/32181_1 /TAXON_ID=1118495 /ORGANISM="Dactyliosolen fragilissimus" /LENGTH=574 /DNA_ID=CAMNT_0027370081 /DNA_START=1 /DNA_END=1725 /DNA_ORIENTATION=+
MFIQSSNEDASRILTASSEGNLALLQDIHDEYLRSRKSRSVSCDAKTKNLHPIHKARCSSGCTALHWAAGSGHREIIQFLIREQIFLDVDIVANKKARGRTALHYASRNGQLETTRYLIEMHGANVNARAKHGVTPFQLAVWQNHLNVCQYLVHSVGVDAAEDVNDFECRAVHWLGICPRHRADDVHASGHDSRLDVIEGKIMNEAGNALIPMATWLASQPGVSFRIKQRQGHTPLHKAAWGGHIALIRYLHKEHSMLDDCQDEAGNFAADLSDMANSPLHALVSRVLREECNEERLKSCKLLGVDTTADFQTIRRAYLQRAKSIHPDAKFKQNSSLTVQTDDSDDILDLIDFDALRKAYEHLTVQNGVGNQSNPSHSIKLMLKLHSSKDQYSHESKSKLVNNRSHHNEKSDDSSELTNSNDSSLFKARLTAVLLEYGKRGLDLCNIEKKWKQVWPDVPFYHDLPSSSIPDVQSCQKQLGINERSSQEYYQNRVRIDEKKIRLEKSGSNQQIQKRRKGVLLEYLLKNASDIIDVVRPDDGKGSIRIVPKFLTREDIIAENTSRCANYNSLLNAL